MVKYILAVLLSTVVLFAWGFMFRGILHWPRMTANAFSDETAVSQVLKANAPQKGIYYLPFPHTQEDGKRWMDETAAFVNVLPEGLGDFMGRIGVGFVLQILSVLLVLLLLRQTRHSSYGKKVLFVALLGLAIGFISQVPLWTFFGFPLSYAAVHILDSLIGWSLVGLVMAKLVD